jgi:hypothetical protein
VHGRLDLRALIEQAMDGLVNLDNRVLRTIGELTVAPAKVCRDYLEGRRVQYVNPFKYAVVTYTFAALVSSALIWLHGFPDDPVAAKRIAFSLSWTVLTNFLAMPVLAAFLWPLFASGAHRLRWVEHCVIVLFVFGHCALLQGILEPILTELGSEVEEVVLRMLTPAMLCWVGVGVYEGRWWTTIARVLLAYFVLETIVRAVIRLFVPEV